MIDGIGVLVAALASGLGPVGVILLVLILTGISAGIFAHLRSKR